MTGSLSGVHVYMPLSTVLRTMVQVRTACCKEVTVAIRTNSLYESLTAIDAITLAVDASPSAQVHL
jgi:hypothetical protein